MSLSYMDWIEKYNLNFQLHITQLEDSPIYKQIDLKEITENLSTFNNTVVDVISTAKINEKYYFKFKYKDNLIGWCSPKNDTIAYIKNKKQETKIVNDENIENDLNKLLEIDTQKLKENWFKIFISDFYAIFNNEIYCSIMLKDELLGFINLKDISFFINYKKDFEFIADEVNLYKDSKLEKTVIENFEHDSKLYSSLGGFEKFNGVRVIINGKRYWTDINNTNISIEKSVVETLDEVIIDALIYQLQEKVKTQNEFYSNQIIKLRDNIKELKEQEKKTKQNIKKLKEIL
ncbi:hypothetical protein BN1048_00586 [Jeotgalicoccus saudimassiliensis]|uniref:GW domain-containing protein n=1 Tax=Jeotgalicoccus saudimassiliensis TaxID=1461582 RepID=A0A078M4T5_9STAP|nr:GW dipeptide domain-containing protein [Jeotgalicoccus saudimassiliensis]CDZ99656.1 hypothetical protein BN1048_00586 [Jeotgalicoccus saudimassiliensis]